MLSSCCFRARRVQVSTNLCQLTKLWKSVGDPAQNQPHPHMSVLVLLEYENPHDRSRISKAGLQYEYVCIYKSLSAMREKTSWLLIIACRVCVLDSYSVQKHDKRALDSYTVPKHYKGSQLQLAGRKHRERPLHTVLALAIKRWGCLAWLLLVKLEPFCRQLWRSEIRLARLTLARFFINVTFK